MTRPPAIDRAAGPARIVYVDHDQGAVAFLREQLADRGDALDVLFVESTNDALVALRAGPVDAVVAAVDLPRADGVSLLRTTKRFHPGVARFALAGRSGHRPNLQLTGLAHQVLSTPATAEELCTVVERSLLLRDRIGSPELVRLLADLDRLPAVPSLYRRVVAMAGDPSVPLTEIGRVIEQDTAMSAKVLQLVNSAFFGLRHRVTSPALAVNLLGINTIMALVLGVQVFSTSGEPLSLIHI